MPTTTAPSVQRRQRERRDPEASRRALLAAGTELFSERGFDGVSIEDVAGRAGVNKALISYHFRGKRGLYGAILESTFRAMAERIEAMENSARDAREALHGVLAAFEQMARERPGFPTLFLREVLSTGIDPVVVPHIVAIVGVSRRLADRGLREGLFRRVDPLLLHFGLFGSLVFFFATEPARREAVRQGRVPFVMPEPKAFLRYLEDLTLRGLARQRPRQPTPRRKGARA